MSIKIDNSESGIETIDHKSQDVIIEDIKLKDGEISV